MVISKSSAHIYWYVIIKIDKNMFLPSFLNKIWHIEEILSLLILSIRKKKKNYIILPPQPRWPLINYPHGVPTWACSKAKMPTLWFQQERQSQTTFWIEDVKIRLRKALEMLKENIKVQNAQPQSK